MIAGVTVAADGAATSGVTVSVVGRNRSAIVADDGTFQINDVPAGSVQLQFRSQSVNAIVPLAPVAASQFVEVRIQVSPTAAVILEETRTEKVQLCHRSEDGRFHRIEVSVSAEPAHRDHGDGAPGEQFKEDPNLRFDANCDLVGPSVAIEKSTNNEDADTPPGPSITVGSTVTWRYVVTNTGTVQLTAVLVTDDQGVVVTCPQTSLAPGVSMTCTGIGVVLLEGQYRNEGKVTAAWSVNGESGSVSDTDLSHYFGISPLEFEKLTNGEDADAAPGPSIAVGSPVLWSPRRIPAITSAAPTTKARR